MNDDDDFGCDCGLHSGSVSRRIMQAVRRMLRIH